MKPGRRWTILLALLLGSFAAAVAVSGDDGPPADVVGAVRRAHASLPLHETTLAQHSGAPMPEAEGGPRLERLDARRIEVEAELLFLPGPKLRPTQEANAPARPAAPALPFKYLGRMIENGRPTLFLAMGERYLAVQAGQVIDDVYRVEAIGDGEAAFVYLPLKEKQTLRMAGEGS